MRPPARIVVAAATYRRPGPLAALLPRLREEAQRAMRDLEDSPQVTVLIVDNDPDGGAEAAVRAAGASPGPEVRYAHEPRPGISAARNRILDEAAEDDADALVLIDDDELPQAGWLTHLVRAAVVHDADAVCGPVHPVVEGVADPWIVATGDLGREERPGLATGSQRQRAATNNLLLDLRRVRELSLRFDLALGLSGGEDSLFTGQLTAAGGRIIWCAEARVDDLVPAARHTRRFHLSRRSAQSATHVTVDRLLTPEPRVRLRGDLRWAAVGAAQIARGGLRVVTGAAVGNLARRASGEVRIASGCGVLIGALGMVISPYARSRPRWRRAPRRAMFPPRQ